MDRKEITIIEDNNQEVKLVIRKPQFEDIEAADRIYASKVSSLIREGGTKKLLLRRQLDEYLKSSGVWTQEDETKLNSLQNEIDNLLNRLRRGGISLKEGRSIAIQISSKRGELVRLNNKRQVFDDITIESMAESERFDYLVYACTVYKDSGDPYWESFEDMKTDKLSEAYQKASFAAYEAIHNVSPDFEKKLPENKWLKKYNFIDDELNFVDRKTGEKVDRDGNPISELEEKIKRQVENLQGDIIEESPFLDEDGKPVILE